MKNILLVIILVGISNIFAQATYFDGSYEETLKYANSQKKNVILLFGNSSCAPCRKIKKDFFGDKEIGAFLNKYFVIKEVVANVRIENNQNVYEKTPDGELSKKFSVAGFPHIEILNVDNISNPVKIVTLRGLDFREIDKNKEYDGNGLPIHFFEEELNKDNGKDKYEFKLDIIKRMFERYVKK
ncbi:thioredoxin family protein [archaeon]|nr:thioredoxin family protein [archaeon]